MPPENEIVKYKQLLVEGDDQRAFFSALLTHINKTGVQIQNFRGKDELPNFLKSFVIAPNYSIVSSIGIVRDAETDPNATIQSISGALAHSEVDLPVPNQPLIPIGDNPQVSYLILPDAASPGMLETLFLQAVADDPVITCINQYLSCVKAETGIQPTPLAKAKIQAFLASRDRSGLKTGHAALKGYLNLDHKAYEHVRRFLQAL